VTSASSAAHGFIASPNRTANIKLGTSFMGMSTSDGDVAGFRQHGIGYVPYSLGRMTWHRLVTD